MLVYYWASAANVVPALSQRLRQRLPCDQGVLLFMTHRKPVAILYELSPRLWLNIVFLCPRI